MPDLLVGHDEPLCSLKSSAFASWACRLGRMNRQKTFVFGAWCISTNARAQQDESLAPVSFVTRAACGELLRQHEV